MAVWRQEQGKTGNTLLSLANLHYTNEEYQPSIDALTEVLRIRPNHAEAQRLKKEATEAEAQRLKKETVEVLVPNYLTKAREFAATARYAEALVVVEEALALDPNHAEAKQLKTNVEDFGKGINQRLMP